MTPERTLKLKILVVDDEDIIRETITGYLSDFGQLVEAAGDGMSALRAIEKRDYDLALLDVKMPGMDGITLLSKIQDIRPDMSVVIMTGHGNMEMVIQALRLGAVDFLTKPVKLLELDAVVEKASRVRKLKQKQKRLKETIGVLQSSCFDFKPEHSFVAVDKAMCEAKKKARMAVEAKCETILITGETGTGKEVVAREIHFSQTSPDTPFIAVSCPALPETLAESELFGHMKGSFTGANEDRAGYFEMAEGGTLFLDEIADLSQSVQAILLRVLETRTVRRVGGSEEIKLNVRVIAATNVALEKLVEEKKFRHDLYYRLNVFSIHLKPLRERPEDILPLADHFLKKYGEKRGIAFEGLTKEACDKLLGYRFPGNARELRNIIEQAAILCPTPKIGVEYINLPKIFEQKSPISERGKSEAEEREYIIRALEEAKWNRRLAAQNLGIPYSTLRYKMNRFGIS